MINHLCREKLDNMNANKKVKIAATGIAVVLFCEEDNEKCRKEQVKPWLQHRNTYGFYSQLLSELRLEVEIYKNYLHMTHLRKRFWYSSQQIPCFFDNQ